MFRKFLCVILSAACISSPIQLFASSDDAVIIETNTETAEEIASGQGVNISNTKKKNNSVLEVEEITEMQTEVSEETTGVATQKADIKLMEETTLKYPIEGGYINIRTGNDGTSGVIGITENSGTTITDVVIPSEVEGYRVTSIGYDAFSGCSGLTSITIPDSVTRIEDNAFDGCSGLTSMIIPDSVTYIGGYAFRNCTALTNITISNNIEIHWVNNYDDWSFHPYFEGCTSLEKVSTPLTFSFEKFYNKCDSIKELVITKQGNSDVRGKNIEKITLNEGITSIYDNQFSGLRNLKEVVLPNSLKTIGEKAFYYCSNLSEINLPDGVTVDESAFRNCGLKKVNVPNYAIFLYTNAFDGCTAMEGLRSITDVNIRGVSIYKGKDNEYKYKFENELYIDTFYLSEPVHGTFDVTDDNGILTLTLTEGYEFDKVENQDKLYVVGGSSMPEVKVVAAKSPSMFTVNGNILKINMRAILGDNYLSTYSAKLEIHDLKIICNSGKNGNVYMYASGFGADKCSLERSGYTKNYVATRAVITVPDPIIESANYLYGYAVSIEHGKTQRSGDGIYYSTTSKNIDENSSKAIYGTYLYLPNSPEIIYARTYYMGKWGNTVAYSLKDNKYLEFTDDKKGDVNGDGEISTKDAVLVLQMSTGKREKAASADVNGDGAVNTKDAVLILRYSVGKISSF